TPVHVEERHLLDEALLVDRADLAEHLLGGRSRADDESEIAGDCGKARNAPHLPERRRLRQEGFPVQFREEDRGGHVEGPGYAWMDLPERSAGAAALEHDLRRGRRMP